VHERPEQRPKASSSRKQPGQEPEIVGPSAQDREIDGHSEKESDGTGQTSQYGVT
jgi:hypothetical protein